MLDFEWNQIQFQFFLPGNYSQKRFLKVNLQV